MPTVLRSAAGSTPGDASVVARFKRGALIVEAASGKQYRLSWEGPGDSADRPIALPAGNYTIRGYKVLANDDAGVPWVLASSGHGLASFEVKQGAPTRVPIDDTVRLVKKWNRSVVSVAVLGQGHAGVSLYRDGKRIPMGYSLREQGGGVAQQGPMEYG